MSSLTKTLFRQSILLSICAALLLAWTTSAQAHEFYSGGYRSRSMGIATSSVNSSWSSYVTPAISSWNNAGVSASISQGGAYANSMLCADLYNGWLGIYEPLAWTDAKSHRSTKFRIRLNTDFNDASGLTKRQTICHELGHALGIGHEDAAAATMRSWSSDYYYPTVDDKNAVIAAWK